MEWFVKGRCGYEFLKGGNGCKKNELWGGDGYVGTSGNKDCQFASRSVLKDFTVDALTISAGSLFQNGIARTMNTRWRRRV